MTDRQTSVPLGSLLELGWRCSRDAMFVCDCRTGLLVEVNPETERLTGYTRHELIGAHEGMLHPEAERIPIQNAFSAAGTDGRRMIEGFHLPTKDNLCIPISIAFSGVLDAAGRRLIIGSFRDLRKLEGAEALLGLQALALRAYVAASLSLANAQSSESLTQDVCKAITQESSFVLAWVGFGEHGPEKAVRVAGAAGSAMSYLDGLELSWSEEKESGQSDVGIALRTGEIQILRDTEAAEYSRPWLERARREGIRSLLTIPFCAGDNCRGALMVYSSRPHVFGPLVMEAFTHLARQIGVGLDKLSHEERLAVEKAKCVKAQEELREVFAGVIGAISTAMEMRDSYTAGHQRRVSDLACAIAQEMGWADDRVEALRMAALVHDVGKIAIPAEILTKLSGLTLPEYLMVKEHPETGYSILKDVPFHWPIAETVRQHHERMDGSGYPNGLKGNAILIEARILAVADIVESMVSARPYRPALGMDVALNEIEQQSGTLLDADVVRICLSLFRRKRFVAANWKQT